MNSKPPTARQLAVLRELAKPGAKAIFMPWSRTPAYWFISRSNLRSCTREINGLLDRGLLKRVNQKPYSAGCEAVINAAGRKVLAEIEVSQ